MLPHEKYTRLVSRGEFLQIRHLDLGRIDTKGASNQLQGVHSFGVTSSMTSLSSRATT